MLPFLEIESDRRFPSQAPHRPQDDSGREAVLRPRGETDIAYAGNQIRSELILITVKKKGMTRLPEDESLLQENMSYSVPSFAAIPSAAANA